MNKRIILKYVVLVFVAIAVGVAAIAYICINNYRSGDSGEVKLCLYKGQKK